MAVLARLPDSWRVSRTAQEGRLITSLCTALGPVMSIHFSGVMAGLGHPRLALTRFRKEDVDARDARAFTPVFDGLPRRHDDGGVSRWRQFRGCVKTAGRAAVRASSSGIER
jgi:hypothetical protein